MSWADIVATISAMCAVLQTGKDLFETFYSRFRSDPAVDDQAKLLQLAMSTYSDEEIEAITGRISGCQKRFMEEGSGKGRTRCLCSVLNDVKDGNGGVLPDIDAWRAMYDQLGCGP